MKGLTKRQKEVLDFIQEFTKEHRYSPSFREIAHHFNFSSVGTVHRLISCLKRKGALENESHAARSLIVKQEALALPLSSDLTLPLIGDISKGLPIELFSDSRNISVPIFLVPSPENSYVLRAQGNSLQEEQILEGDLLIVEARQEALPGEIVIGTLHRHETLVKRYEPEGNYIRLISQSPHLSPLMVREEEFSIQAVLVSLLRVYFHSF